MAQLSPQKSAEMARIADGLPTKSAKIRALAERGYSRAEIARFLDILYQHVRNVLTQPRPEDRAPVRVAAVSSDVYEAPAPFVEDEQEAGLRIFRFPVEQDGVIRLPKDALDLLDAGPGRLVTARFEDGELRLMSVAAAVRFVQRLAAPYIKEGEGNWSDDLIAERRAEAAREAERDAQ